MENKIIIKKFDELTTRELYEILKVRTSIFVVEQECPYQEVDGIDYNSYHLWLEKDGEIKAYLRVFPKADEENTAHFGRMLSTERRKGYASIVFAQGIKVAQEMMKVEKIYLEGQTYVIDLYKKFGFEACGDEFLEDGIPHTPMMKIL